MKEDITERKRADEMIRTLNADLERRVEERTAQFIRAKERMEAILNSSADAILLCRTDGTINQANRAFGTLLGYTIDDLPDQWLNRLTIPQHTPRLEAAFKTVLDSKRSQRLEAILQRQDGGTFEADLVLSPVQAGQETLSGVVCVIRDVTERKRIEHDLHEAEQMLHNVLETLPVRVFWKDRDSHYLGANYLYAQDTGFASSADLIGKSDFELSSHKLAPEYRADDERVMASGLPRMEIEEQVTRADGTTIWVQTNKSPLRDQHGAITGLIGAYVEITQLKRAEAVLERALEQQKELVDLKSRFISMASHDFRTPLTVILSSTSLLEMQITRQFGADQVEPLQKRIQRIDESVQQITTLLDDVLVVNRADTGRVETSLEWLDVERFCQDILQEIQISASDQHDLEWSFDGSDARILSDKKLLRQILVNLLSNAVKYSPEGGKVRLALRRDS